MFRKNTKHLQRPMFGFRNDLSKKQLKALDASEEAALYELIFCNVQEEDFACLYSDTDSRPNAPVNAMLTALILREKRNYTYEELFQNLQFNLLTKTALGLEMIDDIPFCQATLFNFQNKLINHLRKTSENLFEKTFDRMTFDQIKKLKLKTGVQRTDSFSAASNIRSYTRLQLLVEVLIRLHRILDDADRELFSEALEPYVTQTSGQYIYTLKNSDVPHHIEQLAALYYLLHEQLKDKYADDPVFKIFARVFREHFTVEGEKATVKPPDDMSSGSLQSPDDVDATYRNKNGNVNRGQSITLFETADPDNPVNLITDVSVKPNNVGDDKILNKRLDILKEKTPDLCELHHDGAFGGADNDKKCEDLEITPVQTAVKGKMPRVPIQIEQRSEDHYTVSCPHQSVESEPSRVKYKARFDLAVCSQCPLASVCSTILQKEARVYYFIHEDYLRNKRINQIYNIPEERRMLRSNIEATVCEFTRKMPNHKLKVRGSPKTNLFAFAAAIGINFGRIFRYLSRKPGNPAPDGALSGYFVKEQGVLLINFCLFSLKRYFWRASSPSRTYQTKNRPIFTLKTIYL